MVVAYARWAWHALANKIGVNPPHILTNPWVLDGDGVEDRATGVRYRLANIDAPETGDQAKCYKEAERGQLAKWVLCASYARQSLSLLAAPGAVIVLAGVSRSCSSTAWTSAIFSSGAGWRVPGVGGARSGAGRKAD